MFERLTPLIMTVFFAIFMGTFILLRSEHLWIAAGPFITAIIFTAVTIATYLENKGRKCNCRCHSQIPPTTNRL